MHGYEARYALAFVGSLVLSLALTPLALRIAVRREVFDHPAGHKRHAAPMPYLGGVAMCVSFSVAVLIGAVLWQDATPTTTEELAVMLGLALGLCLIGLIDDLRGIGPAVRLAAEVVAGGVLFWQGVGVSLSNNGPIDLALTIVWVVGITNAFNLLDNMDGLSAGVSAIAAASFFAIAAFEGQFLVALLAIALVGCALGFLRHNFQPARIYMGDAGSLFLGFMLAYLGLKLRFDVTTDITVFIPVLVLTVPIVDTTLVVISRIAHGRSPFVGGHDHISHRLLHLGLSVRGALATIYAAAVVAGGVALLLPHLSIAVAWTAAGLVGLGALVAVALLSRVPVYEAEDPAEVPERTTVVTRLADWRARRSARGLDPPEAADGPRASDSTR